MIDRKHLSQRIAFGTFRLLSLTVVGILFAILGFIIYKGIGVISWEFLTTAPKDGMTAGGIWPAIVGTFYLMIGSALFAFPVGVMSGIYMNEYAPKGWIVRFIRMMTNNLSGIPSIVFGLFGMALFVNYMGFGDSILAGSLTLGLLCVPLVIRTTEEALKAIPDTLREGSRALGATKLQTIWHVILPMAMPNVITGLILALGRVSEGNGEDPYLGSEIAKAMVRGYQGEKMERNDEVMACVKHFALYGAIEAGRDYNTVDMSRNRMFNEYFPPYKAAAEAGAGSFMSSFNEVDGIPATANRWLMTDVLRNQWGFDGFVVTDYTAIAEMVDHGIGDLQEVSARALKAGTDMDMVADGFIGTLEKSLKEGKVSMQDIDTACRRMLEAKYKLGLFKDPYKYCDLKRPAKDLYNAEHRAEARRIAAESFVLLKNQNNLLPLQKKGNIALIGPLANTRTNMPGTWSVAATPQRYSTLLEGLQRAVGNQANVLYAQGSNLMYDADYQTRATMFGREIPRGDDKKLLEEALNVAAQADVIVAALGESSEMSGECSSRTELEMPDAQRDLLDALLKTGKPVVLVHFSGRPTVMTWEQQHVPSILNVWFGGSESADAICDVLFGDVCPSGKLTATFPQSVGQLPMNYNHKNTGRPLAEGRWFEKFRSNYIDVSNDPLYPFGYGLSYTTFAYSDMQLSADSMNKQNGELTASITVTNTGNYDADEIVQLYIRDIVGSITRPVKELKGFQRIHLKKGESKKVSFKITPELLKFYDYDLKYVCEPGDFNVMIGSNSQDVSVLKFTVTE